MPTVAAPSHPGRFSPAGVLALTLAVFGAVVALVTWQQRSGLREQILRREADRLTALAAMQLNISARDAGFEAVDAPGGLLVAVLKATDYAGVLGVRVFDARGNHSGSDGVIAPIESATTKDWNAVTQGEAIVRLHTRLPDEEMVFTELLPENARLLEVWVPLRRRADSPLLGAAQFWLRGDDERAELAQHDRRVWLMAGAAWLGGSLAIGTALSWAFRRLATANRDLRVRSEDLQRANRELVLAAKTSALGAVTAHLMHELKNPLAGLEEIVAGQADATVRGEAGGELAAASALTRRLRVMVNDVVGVLRDEQSGAEFELSSADMVEIVEQKVKDEAARRGVALEARDEARIAVAGRRGNLAILVLRNLVQNALEATKPGGTVRLQANDAGSAGIEFLIEDTGSGLAPAVRERLFQPCSSTKVGGSGVGLALSYQLAQQAGGRLELVRSDSRGTSFRLVLAPAP